MNRMTKDARRTRSSAAAVMDRRATVAGVPERDAARRLVLPRSTLHLALRVDA